MLVFIIFNGRLEGPKKIQNVNIFQKGGGQPQSLHFIKSLFWRINKKSKVDFKNLLFKGGRGGSQGQFEKSLHFAFFWTLPLLSSGTQKALLDMKLNFHLIKRQNQTFFD